ncbi:unnamed protein product [Brassica oleracea var. botrytis]
MIVLCGLLVNPRSTVAAIVVLSVSVFFEICHIKFCQDVANQRKTAKLTATVIVVFVVTTAITKTHGEWFSPRRRRISPVNSDDALDFELFEIKNCPQTNFRGNETTERDVDGEARENSQVLRKVVETKNSRRKTYIIMKMSNTSDGSREVREPLVDKDMAESKPEQPWMVYLSTFVAVCGSCPGYSSPAQAAIRNDLFRTIAEFSLFGSLLTFGAMIGAITSGPIADLVGRKGVRQKKLKVSIRVGFVILYMPILLVDLLYPGDESFFCFLCRRLAIAIFFAKWLWISADWQRVMEWEHSPMWCQSLFFAGGATAEHLAADIGDLVLINCYLKLDVILIRKTRCSQHWTFVGVLPHIESKKEQEENSIKSKSLEAVIKKDLPEISPEAKAQATEAKAIGQDTFTESISRWPLTLIQH